MNIKHYFNFNNKYILLSLISIISAHPSSASAQYYNTSQMMMQSNMQPQYVTQPVINSVYATPMRRINEIPLYGKNKSMYLYDGGRVTEDENPFADSVIYMFAGFSTGPSAAGLNSETSRINPYTWAYGGGSDANDSMGDASGFTIGIGRRMSSILGVEFSYAQYSGMNYGTYANVISYEEEEIYDEDDEPTGETEDVEYVSSNEYQVIKGGDISTDFIGIGLRYSLEGMFGNLLGMFKPYVGVHVGITHNTIEDYTIKNPYESVEGDSIDDVINADWLSDLEEAGEFFYGETKLNQQFTFIGTTSQSFGVGLEVGFTMAFGSSLELDLFYKYNSFGTIETSGEVLTTYESVVEDFYITQQLVEYVDGDCPEGYNYIQPAGSGGLCVAQESYSIVQEVISNTKESADMNFNQFGIKAKYFF